MKVIIPMAGAGSRFSQEADKNPEYKKMKPLINVFDRPMIVCALESLPFLDLPNRKAKTDFKLSPKDLVFIVLQAHQDQYQIGEKLRELFSNEINIVTIPEMTRGAAETALKARQYFTDDEAIIISDSDHYFDGLPLYESIQNKDEDTVGIIPVSKLYDPFVKLSYTLTKDDKYAIKIAEKDPELAAKGAYANIGAYFFSKAKTFVDEVELMIKNNETYGPENRKEFYIAPIYQRLIEKGMKVEAAIIKKGFCIGTPSDLEYFYSKYDEVFG